MSEAAAPNVPDVPAPVIDEDGRLGALGYRPLHTRFSAFCDTSAVWSTPLSQVGAPSSLSLLAAPPAGPASIGLPSPPLIGMFFAPLVFGESASHYPVAGALYQYSKFSVGPAY